ncbi:hypothetical protein OK016_17905 [Vibrio chagasii]|nr:hypothetical protein [Vibrio chagasii]
MLKVTKHRDDSGWLNLQSTSGRLKRLALVLKEEPTESDCKSELGDVGNDEKPSKIDSAHAFYQRRLFGARNSSDCC